MQRAGIELRRRKGDAPVAAFDQVAGQVTCRVLLRKPDAVNPFVGTGFHQVHAGHAAAGHELARCFGVVEAGDQQSGGAVQQLLSQQLLFFAGVVVGHADQRLKALATQARLHGFDQSHKEFVGEHRNQHGDMRAALRRQGARGGVGHVAEFVGGGAHPLHQFGRNGAGTTQRARYRDRTDVGRPCDIGQGDTSGGALAVGRGWHGLGFTPRAGRSSACRIALSKILGKRATKHQIHAFCCARS